MRLKFWQKRPQHLPEWFATNEYGLGTMPRSEYASRFSTMSRTVPYGTVLTKMQQTFTAWVKPFRQRMHKIRLPHI